MTCTTKKLYKSIEACPGKKVMPGIRRRLYYIDKRNIAKFPKLTSLDEQNLTDMAKLAQYKGNFELVQDKFFQYIDLKDEASNVKFDPVGEEGSKLYNNQATMVVAGLDDEVKGFCRQVLDDDLVLVYQDRAGKFCVLGNEMFTCKINPSGDSGTEATSSIITSFDVQCYDECPVPTYLGELPLSATTYVNCETGEVMEREQEEHHGE